MEDMIVVKENGFMPHYCTGFITPDRHKGPDLLKWNLNDFLACFIRDFLEIISDGVCLIHSNDDINDQNLNTSLIALKNSITIQQLTSSTVGYLYKSECHTRVEYLN